MTDQEAVQLIQSLEPVFYEEGRLAVDLQRSSISSMKGDSGRIGLDIVTSADLAVQEFVLTRLARTALVDCKLFAEEDTPTVGRFNSSGEIVLSLDPIGGTVRYARGEAVFSVNVALRRGAQFLYSFVHHPAINWTTVIVNGSVEERGRPPAVQFPPNSERVITRTYGDPKTTAPALVDQLETKGYQFKLQRELAPAVGATDAYLMGAVGGFYIQEPNAYDGFIGLHYAQAKGFEIVANAVDWTTPYLDDKTWRYPGHYVVLNQPAR